MAFDKRGYYYRSTKRRGRVDRIYFGKGPAANSVAKLDAIRCQEHEEKRLAVKRERDAVKTLDDQLERLDILADAAAAAALEDAGFHRHKGEWRKRRDRTISSTDESAFQTTDADGC